MAFKPSLWLALAGVFVITSLVYSALHLAANKICQNVPSEGGRYMLQGWRQIQSDVWFIVENWLLQGLCHARAEWKFFTGNPPLPYFFPSMLPPTDALDLQFTCIH